MTGVKIVNYRMIEISSILSQHNEGNPRQESVDLHVSIDPAHLT